MGDKLNSFCINISKNGEILAYSIYPTTLNPDGVPSLVEQPIVSQSELTANGGFSAIKSQLTEMFTKHISLLPKVYEARYKYKVLTRLQESASNFGRSAQGAVASFVNAPGNALSTARNSISNGQSVGIEPQVENSESFETNPLVDNSQPFANTLPATSLAQGTMTAKNSMVGGPPNVNGGTRRKRIKKSRKSRKHSNNIAI